MTNEARVPPPQIVGIFLKNSIPFLDSHRRRFHLDNLLNDFTRWAMVEARWAVLIIYVCNSYSFSITIYDFFHDCLHKDIDFFVIRDTLN